MKCSECVYWNGDCEISAQADCRRHSPVNHPIVDQGVILWRFKWPITAHDDFCGDFANGFRLEGPGVPGEIRELVNIAASIELPEPNAPDFSPVDTVNALEELILKARDIVETTL